MCEPTFEEWFLSFAGELARLNGELPDFDAVYDRYFPAYENGICGGTCARLSVSDSVEEYELEEFA